MHFLFGTVVVAAALALAQSSAPWPNRPPATFADLAYPPAALAARVTGRVVVRVTTDETGHVVKAASLSGPDALAPAAIANVKQWTLSPGARVGTVVYLFAIDPGLCNDESHGLFRLVYPNLAVVTACTARAASGRQWPPPPPRELELGVRRREPIYPPIALSARVSGLVVMELTFDAKGAVIDVRPLTGLPLLAEAAVADAKTWRALEGGRRHGIIVYEYALDGPACAPNREPAVFSWVTSDYIRVSGCQPIVDP